MSSLAVAAASSVSRPRYRHAAGIAVSGVTAAVGLAVLARHGWPRPVAVRWDAALAAVVLMVAANDVVCGARWSLFRSGNRRVWDSIRRYSEAAMVGTFVPFAGDAWRARGGRAALDGVALDRFVSGGVLALVAVISSALLAYRVGAVALVAAALVGVAAGWFAIRRRLGLTAVRPRTLAVAAGLTVLYLAVAAASFGLAIAAAGAPVEAARVALITPLVLLAAAIPSVAGLGPGTALLAWSVTAGGGDAGQATSVAAIVVLGQLGVWLAGSASLLARGARRAA